MRFSAFQRPWLLALLLLIALAMAVRIFFAAGFIPVDDAEYARIAARILDGTFSRENHFGPPVNPGRLGIVLPLLLSFKIFGPSEVSMAIYPLAISLLTTVLVFLFTSRVFGRPAGLIASALWIFVPMDIEFAAKVNPDTAVTAFCMLAIYVIYCARLQSNLNVTQALARGLGAGLCFGIAWLCKASTIYFAPFCAMLLLYDLLRERQRLLPLWGGVAAGSILVFGAEMIYYASATGDWLYRFFIIERNYQLYPEFFFNEGAQWGYEVGTPYWKAVFKRLFLEGPVTFFLRDDYMYLPTIGLIASAYGLYKRDLRFYFVIVLFASLLFMFNFFSASLENYQPLPLFTRYSHSLCFVGVVLTAGLLHKLVVPALANATWKQRPDNLFWGAVVAVFLCIAAGWTTFRKARDTSGTWASAERYLAGVIRPEDRVYTDALSRSGLEFFWKYPQSMNVTNIDDLALDATIPCDSYVLLNDKYSNWLTTNFGMWYTFEPFELPDVARNPPDFWERTWTNGNARLYSVSCSAG